MYTKIKSCIYVQSMTSIFNLLCYLCKRPVHAYSTSVLGLCIMLGVDQCPLCVQRFCAFEHRGHTFAHPMALALPILSMCITVSLH